MDRSIESALRIIEGTGPVGAYIASAIVGLALALIVFAYFGGVFDRLRGDVQRTNFLGRVMIQYDKLAASEAALRREAERIEAENDALKDRQRELLISVELLRVQLRRAIDLLTAVRDGRLQASEIEGELAELVK